MDPEADDPPNLNTGKPWSNWDDNDIRWSEDHGRSIEETAKFLCRARAEIRQRIAEIAEADAVGDPSWLLDGMTRQEKLSLDTYRDARAAMALIREAIEDCAPPGAVARAEYLGPEFTVEAEALVRGIYALAQIKASCGAERAPEPADRPHAR